MTWNISTTSKRRFSAKLAGGFALAAVLALGAFTAPANAEWRGDGDRGDHYYGNGYYRAPPVAYGSYYGPGYYGSPYYAPPPVVYGPGIGINLGGIGIGIR